MSPAFTTREFEVCTLVVLDMTAEQIATVLEIQVSTVRTMIRNAARKLPGKERARTRILLHFYADGQPKNVVQAQN